MTAQVMNGKVGVGDTIAYATRQGSSLDMRIAVVLDIALVENPRWYVADKPVVPVLKVRVTQTSESFMAVPYETKITVLDRVVKL
jgi:hypothetical protein